MKDDKRNTKISQALELEDLILFKWPYCLKQSKDWRQTLAKHLFLKQVQIFLKFTGSHTRPKMAKANMGKKETKNKVEATTLLDFRPNCKATEIQTAWYWHSNRHRALWNRRDPRHDPKVNPGTYSQWIHNVKGTIYNSKSVSSTCVAGKTGHPHGQQRELNISTGLQET